MVRRTLFLTTAARRWYRRITRFAVAVSPIKGHTTHAVYVFVTMPAAHCRPPSRVPAASFDLAGPTFRDQLVTDYKGQPRRDADDLKEQLTWGTRLRGDGRADPDRRGLRS